MNKNIAPVGIALAIVLGIGAVGCSSNDRVKEFTKECNKKGGKVVRENDLTGVIQNSSFSKPAPKPAKPKNKAPKVKPNGGAKIEAPAVAEIPNAKPTKKSKPKKKHDNDYLCVDGDNIIMEMDE